MPTYLRRESVSAGTRSCMQGTHDSWTHDEREHLAQGRSGDGGDRNPAGLAGGVRPSGSGVKKADAGAFTALVERKMQSRLANVHKIVE
jgi:hypothetical protein